MQMSTFLRRLYIFKSGRPSRQMVQTQLGGSIGRNAWTWPQHKISKWKKMTNWKTQMLIQSSVMIMGTPYLQQWLWSYGCSTSFFPIARKTSPLTDSHVVAGSTLWNQTMEVIQMTNRWWYDTCWMTLSLRHGGAMMVSKKGPILCWAPCAKRFKPGFRMRKWSELVPYSYNLFPISISGVNWIRLLFFFSGGDIRYPLYRDGVKICWYKILRYHDSLGLLRNPSLHRLEAAFFGARWR